MRCIVMIPLSFLLLSFASSCADDSEANSPPLYQSGSASIGPKEGIDFATGEKMSSDHPDCQADPEHSNCRGTFANSDIYGAENGDALSLLPGGETSANSRPVNWFELGGKAQHFDNLADVPGEPEDLPSGTGFSLPYADTGNAFIVENARADNNAPRTYTKGWISTATALSVTIEYEAIE